VPYSTWLREGILKPLAKGVILDLAVYEVINAVWKEHYLLRHIDEETVKELLDVLERVFDVVTVASVRSEEARVFELAVKEGLTIYDAAYLYYAAKNKLILVTDDAKLREKAKQYVETITTRELMSR
jgi:predicted nucleic acid-binding protein